MASLFRVSSQRRGRVCHVQCEIAGLRSTAVCLRALIDRQEQRATSAGAHRCLSLSALPASLPRRRGSDASRAVLLGAPCAGKSIEWSTTELQGLNNRLNESLKHVYRLTDEAGHRGDGLAAAIRM